MEDYKEIYKEAKEVQNLLTKKEKLAVMEKFNLSCPCKIKDIEHAILGIANEKRKSSGKLINQFDEDDYRMWNSYWGHPESLKKLREAVEGESSEFIGYLLRIFDTAYRRTVGRVYEDKRYFNLLKIQEENSDAYKKNLEREETIYERLTILTFDFKTKMYNRFIMNEKERFDKISKYNEKTEEELYQIRKDKPKLYSVFVQMKSRSKDFDWNIYREYLNEEFESMFSNNIRAIAQRINTNRKVNINNLKLQSIDDDPKFFELVLRDCGGHTIHCRSIIAAEYSVLVQMHYRFIITVK